MIGATLPATTPIRTESTTRRLRFRLFLLAASGLVPLALVLLLASVYLARDRQTQTQRAAFELSHAIATAVDAELRGTSALLENLAAAAQMGLRDRNQLASADFVQLTRRVIESEGWRSIVVADDRGEILTRLRATGGGDNVLLEPESMARVLASRSAVVGRVVSRAGDGESFAVRIPVFQGERLRYVVSAVVPTSQILAVVARQQLAPSWIVGVFDQTGTRVARSREAASTRYSPSLEALITAQGDRGMGMTRTLEGVRSHSGYTRVQGSQWIVAVGIPASEAHADLYRLLGAVGAGTVASLGLLAWLAWRLARGISAPIDALKQAAAALGGGQQLALPTLDVEELDEVGRALGQAAIDRDQANAHRDAVEAEREQLLRRVEEALRVAEQANRNKDEFLALLGHELRNPLAPIMNAVHLMGLKGDDRTAGERQIIQRQLKYVNRLVDDLLDASRITSERFVIDFKPVQAVALLEEVIETLQPVRGGRTLELQVGPGARRLWVQADEARLVQIFNNLLGNAIKFTGTTGRIRVHAQARPGAIEFTIEDDGAGMSPEGLARAFELFYQAPNSTRGVSAGLGLGLAIVKSLVEKHGGNITARSPGLGQGTTLCLVLPITAPPLAEAVAMPGPTAIDPCRVLVVDDNRDAADTLAALLEASGLEVQVSYAPEPALAAFAALQPAVAVLDIGLPGMSGYELVRRLRELAGGPACKIIALTGYGQDADVRRALGAGFDAHLTKPVSPDTLLQLVARLVRPEAAQ